MNRPKSFCKRSIRSSQNDEMFMLIVIDLLIVIDNTICQAEFSNFKHESLLSFLFYQVKEIFFTVNQLFKYSK